MCSTRAILLRPLDTVRIAMGGSFPFRVEANKLLAAMHIVWVFVYAFASPKRFP